VLFFLFVALVFFSSALVFLVLAWVVAVEWLREREHLALEQNLHEAGGLGGQGGRQTVDRGPGLPCDDPFIGNLLRAESSSGRIVYCDALFQLFLSSTLSHIYDRRP